MAATVSRDAAPAHGRGGQPPGAAAFPG